MKKLKECCGEEQLDALKSNANTYKATLKEQSRKDSGTLNGRFTQTKKS